MKKVLILGAGLVTKPCVDYFLDECGFEVIMATRTTAKAEKIIAGRPNGKAITWTTDQLEKLDQLVSEVELAKLNVCATSRTAHYASGTAQQQNSPAHRARCSTTRACGSSA